MTLHLLSVKHITGETWKKEVKKVYECDDCDFETVNKINYLSHKLNNHSTKKERKNNLHIIVNIAMLVYLPNHHITNI